MRKKISTFVKTAQAYVSKDHQVIVTIMDIYSMWMSYRGGSEQILIIFVPCGIYLLYYVFVLQRWYAGCWAMNMEWPSAAHHMVTTHPPCLLCDPNVTAQRNRLPNVTW